MKGLRAGLVLCLLSVTLGCSLLDLLGPSSEPVVIIDPTMTPSPAPPTETPAPLPPPTAAACPPYQDVALPTRTADLDAYTDLLRDFLHRGGDPGRLVLEPLEGLLRGDLIGDYVPEIVLSIVDTESLQVPPPSRMLIFTCDGGGILSPYQYDPGEWMGLELIGIQDLTGDGQGDLVFSDVNCGAHTCWHTPHVWSWTGNDFTDAVTAPFQYPYPAFELRDAALVVVSGGIGSAGAGPQRSITTTLSWKGDLVTATAESVAPPAFRYHALVDGDLAFGAGEFDAAQALYQRVLDDASLTEWGGWSGEDAERSWLRALGQWRLMVLSAYRSMEVDAESYYGALVPAPDSTAPEAAVSALAERYWRSYERDGDPVDACAYAVDTEEVVEVTIFLNGFGYANPWYEAPDICPYHGALPR